MTINQPPKVEVTHHESLQWPSLLEYEGEHYLVVDEPFVKGDKVLFNGTAVFTVIRMLQNCCEVRNEHTGYYSLSAHVSLFRKLIPQT